MSEQLASSFDKAKVAELSGLVTPAVNDLFLGMDTRSPEEICEGVWEELGRRYKPLRWLLMVRTDPMPTCTAGGIFLTQKESDFYSGMPHMKIIKGTVLARGPQAKVEALRVCFQRLYFTRVGQLSDGTYVGLVDENQLTAYLTED